MAKSGPFWDDERQSNEDDYFEYQGHDVTNQGLGEVSRRVLVGTDANAFSFTGSALGFTRTPLCIQHGLAEAPIEMIDVENYWQLDQLQKSLELLMPLNCWQDVQSKIKQQFADLIISDDVMNEMLATPFTKTVMERIFILLGILNQLVVESDASGKLSSKGEEILANYFAGTCGTKTPVFKPETPSNKRSFKEALTFPDPTEKSKTIFCHWHGKIQTPQTRIHFEWPRPNGQQGIKVVYIGPKITKT
jgi:hypothetical protein